MKTRRAFLEDIGRIILKDIEISPGADSILVKVAVCGLCNWELNHWKGLKGPFPLTLGHEWAGIVVEKGENVEDFLIGDTVTGLHCGMAGFSDYLTTNSESCFKIDKDIDPLHALGEPLKCIITVLRAVMPEAGDHGTILGCGPMGLWCIQALAGDLCSSIIAVDIDDQRLALARKFGATHIINSMKEDAVEQISKITKEHMADFVIEGTGKPSLMNTAIDYIKSEGRGRLILMSSHEEITKEIDFRKAIRKSLEIKMPHPYYSIDEHDDMRRAVQLINNGVFKMDDIITHRFKLKDIQIAFQTLENKPSDFIKGVVIP